MLISDRRSDKVMAELLKLADGCQDTLDQAMYKALVDMHEKGEKSVTPEQIKKYLKKDIDE